MPPTFLAITLLILDFFRLENGKIVEHPDVNQPIVL